MLSALTDRKIFRWLALYLAGAWLLLQVLDFFGNHFHWSDIVVPIATVVLAAGFFAAAIIAWFHGEHGYQRVTPLEIALLIVVALAGAGGVVALERSRAAEAARTSTGPSVDASSAAILEQSVAVLPFINISGLAENKVFSDGITEEILNALAKVQGLNVTARTSAFAVRDQTGDPREMGRILRVAHILDGSVQRSGDRARITAKLTDARSGSLLWSDHYDPDLKDIFAVEDSISRAIAEQLRIRIGGDAPAATATVNVAAHDFYLNGLSHWNHRNVPSLHQARDLFLKAIAADSTYAAAWAGVALAYALIPEYDTRAVASTNWKLGREAAQKALVLDDRSAEAHAALSQIAEYSNQVKSAEQEIRLALALNPNYVTAHYWLCEILILKGQPDEALREADAAVRLDPLSVVAVHLRAAALGLLGRDAEAFTEFDKTIAMDPQFSFAANNAAHLALIRRRYDLALKYTDLAFADAASRARTRLIVDGLSNPAKKPALLAAMSAWETTLPELFGLVSIYEISGQREAALSLAARLQHDPVEATNLRFALNDPSMKGLREDPRMPAAYKPGLDR